MTGPPEIPASRTLRTTLVATVVVLLVVVGVVAYIRSATPPTDPAPGGGQASKPTTSQASPRLSNLVPPSSAPQVTGVLEVSGPACDAAVINADLLFPNSGARILDCRSGWAVMASAITGDPYWVEFSDGRWRRAGDVSIYQGTCVDEAVARGAPVWMARKYLGDCRAWDRGEATARTVAPGPAVPSSTATSPLPAAVPTRISSPTPTPPEDTTQSETSPTRTSITTPTSTPSTSSEVPTSTPPVDAPGPP